MRTIIDRYGQCVLGDESYFNDILREVCVEDTYGFAEIAGRDPVGVAVDMGASFGAATRMICHHWPEAKVVAYEMDGFRYSLLRENCPQADCRQVALCGYMGQTKAFDGIGFGGHWRTDPRQIFGWSVQEDGDGFTLPDAPVGLHKSVVEALQGVPEKVDLLKIDIEGFELGILREWAEIRPMPSVIVGEWHFRNTLDGLRALLEPTHDFWWQEPSPGAGPWHLFKARKKS